MDTQIDKYTFWFFLACPVGNFGENCSETCISSFACDGCNNDSGLCDYRCRHGWIGYFCQKSKKLSYFNFDV